MRTLIALENFTYVCLFSELGPIGSGVCNITRPIVLPEAEYAAKVLELVPVKDAKYGSATYDDEVLGCVVTQDSYNWTREDGTRCTFISSRVIAEIESAN